DGAAAQLLAERIRQAISATPVPVTADKSEVITVSIGIAGCSAPRSVSDLKSLGESLLARADVALYRAKSEGRDRVAMD
ncbi:MAG: diguanylate cyclase, partial [Halioglobus sp.]|nr:diguanylate cyclase [Halioglobus sp.]